jgi:glycosyltransferase involved in cell wall biosynthesis
MLWRKIMKVLWVVNILMPDIARAIGKESSVGGGWLIGLHKDLLKVKDIEMCICCPIDDNKKVAYNKKIDGTEYVLFKRNPYPTVDSQNTEIFTQLLNKTKPDIIHIFGTEYTHTYSAVMSAKKLGMQKKVIISIQGLVSIIAKHFYAGLPEKVVKSHTFREILKRDNIKRMKRNYEVRGKYEIKAISSVNNIIGRTDWDRACIKQINSKAKYYKCNETLRQSFYEDKWNLESCEKHSIFFTQSSMPIKGFHKLLEAMPLVLNEFPDTKIYITGTPKTLAKDIKSRLSIRTYDRYLQKLIKRYHLADKVRYLGNLDEKEMKEAFLKANVFVSASSIENSPNSVGEAMLLGVPTVSSFVGGVNSMIKDKRDGLLYAFDAEYMLAYYICEIFRNPIFSEMISTNARIKSRETHNNIVNLDQLLTIYQEIL